MKIAICASIVFSNEIIKTADALRKYGHDVEVPFTTGKILKGEESLGQYNKIKNEKGDSYFRKKAGEDLIKQYFRIIGDSDAILVLNIDKNGIKHYIGPNTFLEMGFAHVLNKKIFLLNDIPHMNLTDEVNSMAPVIIHGDLSRVHE